MASSEPEPPNSSGKGAVRPVCARVRSRSVGTRAARSASRPCGRSCSSARLCARLRISSCSSVGAKFNIAGLYPFDNHRVRRAAALADRLQAIASAAALKFVQQHRGDARAGGAERMTNGDRAAVDVDLCEVGPGGLLPGQHNAGECLVDFDQIHLLQAQAGLLQDLLGGGNIRGEHQDWIVSSECEGDETRARLEAQALGGRALHNQHSGGSIADLRGIAGGDQAIGLEGGFEAGQLLQAGIGADALVALEKDGFALFVFDRNRQNLTGETSLGGRARGSPVALQAELIELFAGDLPFLRNQFCADALMDQPMIVAFNHQGTKGRAGTLRGRSHRHARHRFDAASDYDIIRASEHALGGEMNGLLAGPALAVHRCARHRFGETGGQDRVASNIQSLLADLADAAHNHIIYQPGLDACALYYFFEDLGHQIHRVPVFQASIAAPDRGTHGCNNHGFAFCHGSVAPCSLALLYGTRRTILYLSLYVMTMMGFKVAS